MVLMNLCAGPQWRHRHTEQTCGQSGRSGTRERRLKHTHCHMQNQTGSGSLITQGAQICCSMITQRGGMGWEVTGRFKREGDMYTYGMGIPDHLTCLLRNLYAGREATVRTGHGQ